MIGENTRVNAINGTATTSHYAMGTVMAHKAYGLRAEESLKAVQREITRLEGLLSRFIPNSDVSRINKSSACS